MQIEKLSKIKKFFLLLFFVFFFFVAADVSAASGEVQSFGGSHISPKSKYYTVKVNGQEVFVHSWWGNHYAHFSMDGTASIQVTTGENISDLRVSPRRLGISPNIDSAGKKFSFTLDQPKKLVIAVNLPLSRSYWGKMIKPGDPIDKNGMNLLFLFPESKETNVPKLGQAGVVNVRDFGAKDTNADNSSAIESAIQSSGASVIYFPSGHYRTKRKINVSRDNLTIYLAPGAFVENTSSGNYHNQQVFSIVDRNNITIRGRGVLQSNVTVLRPIRTTDFTIEGVILRRYTSDRWAFTPIKLDNAVIRNIKVLGKVVQERSEDAMDINACRNIIVEDNFTFSGDDGIAIKAFEHVHFGDGPPRPSWNYTIRNNVIYSYASNLKTGSEIDEPVDGVLFEGNDIVRGGILITSRDAAINDLVIRDNWVEEGYLTFFGLGYARYDGSYNKPIDLLVEDLTVTKVYESDENVSIPYDGLYLKGFNKNSVFVRFKNLRLFDPSNGSYKNIRSTNDFSLFPFLNSRYTIDNVTASFAVASGTPTEVPNTPTDMPETPGDLDGDGDVDIFDYNILVGNFGRSGINGFISADINENGEVDIFDYNFLIGNFGG